jgi:hypothetical protein
VKYWFQEGYGTKIKGIHFLNAPSFVDKILVLLKQALKEKIADRIHVHNSNEDLHKHIAKEILPKDFGGDEISCGKLAGKKDKLYLIDNISPANPQRPFILICNP